MAGVPIQIPYDTYFSGMVTPAGGIALPPACVGAANITGTGAAGLAAQNLIPHMRLPKELADAGTTVTATANLKYLFTAKAAGVLLSFVGVITGAIPIGAYGFTVDLLKSTGGAAPVSVLTTKITATSASALLTALFAAIATAGYIAGDSFFLNVALTGGSGTQAVGLGITLSTAEQYV
jgi:hypothetical protein